MAGPDSFDDVYYEQHVEFDVEYGFYHEYSIYDEYEFEYDNNGSLMEDSQAQALARVDAAYWAELRKIRLQKGVWSFSKRDYLLEPMHERIRRVCYQKATQGGYTELEVLKSLHGMIYGMYPRGVLYLFPTANDIRDFSQARFGRLISSNPKVIGNFVQSTNSAHLKRVRDAFLYLRGGTLAKTLDFDAREAASLRGISVDRVVYDEEDLMDPEAIAKARQRMGDSDVKEEVHISNPTLPGYGVSKHFEASDQRYRHRKCSACGEYTCAILEFPACVKMRKDGTGYVACKKCGKEVPPDPAVWVAKYPDRSDYMHGYQWSQLESYQNDPGEILAEYTDPPEGNLADIVRLRLGKPYVAAEDRLRQSDVLSCCGDYGQLNSSDGPCAMGIDCQKPKRVVIGARTGRDSYSVFRVMPYGDHSWDGLTDLVRRFNVKSVVIDIRPYEDSARECQKRLNRLGVIVFLCEYSETTPIGSSFNTKSGICKVNRTEVLDQSHRVVTTQGKLNLPHRCPEIEEFAKQMCATAKILDPKKGHYRYRKLGTDDYRHAMNYFILAADGRRVGTANNAVRRSRPRYAVNDRQDSRFERRATHALV